jgi:hypothetical protein
MSGTDELSARTYALERQVRVLQRVLGAVMVAVAVGVLAAWQASPEQRVVRAEQIVIEDERGRARMLIGRQSTFGGQRAPFIGLSINDTLGYERFGMGLRANGRMSMGFDAPLGKGDDRNRERINIIADEEGGAQIRFLDRQTAVKGRLSITPDNRFVIEFLDFSPGTVKRRLIDFSGDTVVTEPRSR